MKSLRTLAVVRAALIAALVGAGALIAIPLGPVPFTLQTLVVAVAALVLSPAEALLALALYVAIGAVGAPVFSGGTGGLGILAGPTGGFLVGFVVGVTAAAFVRRTMRARTPERPQLLADIAALFVLFSVTYLLGWGWFSVVTGREAAEAFAIAIAPFVPVDLAKGAVAVPVARALRAAGFATS